MKTKIENGTLTIFAEGKIDTSNAAGFEQELQAIRAKNPAEYLVLDCEKLEYISSFGLRVILRLRREEPSLRLIGVNPEVYDIFDMTGFTEMIPIEKAFRRVSVNGCTVIGKGAKGTVYRLNPEIIIKVYRDSDCLPQIRKEQELARKAFVLGVPTALSYDVVKVGEQYGSVFELLDAKSFSELIREDPDGLESYVNIYADMLRKIHAIQAEPGSMPDIKMRIHRWLTEAENYLPEQAAQKLRELISATPDSCSVLHCDYHTNNLLMQGGEALLIDMDTLSLGHPIFELANVFVTYVGFGYEDPSNVEQFLGIDYTTSKKIWDLFLPRYLGTKDPERLADVEKKAKLLSDLRILRHIGRREGAATEIGRRSIAGSVKRILEALPEIDTLDF